MSRRPYWWVYQIFEGRPVILGPLEDEEMAHEIGRDKFKGDYKVVEFYTLDKQKATSAIKAKILDETSSLEKALRRASHPDVGLPPIGYADERESKEPREEREKWE